MKNLMTDSPVCAVSPPKNYKWKPSPFHVVFQFCGKDYGQAIKVLEWSRDLAKQPNNELHLVTDEGFMCDTLLDIVRSSWGKIVLHRIKPCSAAWPACNNHVFAQTCRIMKKLGRPWLLWETDMIPAKPDWLQALEKEYDQAQKPFMGSWVEAYDILNGGAIYPPDVIAWCGQFFEGSAIAQPAFDCAIAPSIIWFTHPANHMIANVFFTKANGRPSIATPNLPSWDKRLFDWVMTHNMCLIHRDKKGETIKFLRERLVG